MIIRSVASAYTKTNPTEPVHVVDKVHHLYVGAVTWHVVLTRANLIAGLSDRNVAPGLDIFHTHPTLFIFLYAYL